jgi:DNA primase
MAQDTVGEIKERLNIQDIIAPYVKLHRAGKSLVGLCPFHKEKSPSFHVSSERGSWHCFGCGLGGDGFSFIEKIEGVDFKEALKMLAEKAGVVVQYSQGASREDASKKDRLRALMSRACELYKANLGDSPAEKYAKSRGLTDESIVAWSLGFAPDSWRFLLEALTAEGYTIPELLGAGLIKEADGKAGTYYDRFRNRLMFPIRDVSGRVVAFTGRILPSASAGGEVEPAKYLNSPETELFRKSETLFGIERAKDAIRVRKFTLLVEGQMDVLLSHQAGFTNAVALSGTALSEKHLALLKRYSDNLMLVLDADTAGRSATARSAQLALIAGLRVKAVRLPLGKDPADLVREDVKDFTKRISEAKPVVEFFLAELAEKESDPHRLLRTAEAIVLPLIAVMQSPMERDHFIQSTARTLGLSTEAVRESVMRIKKLATLVYAPNAPTPTSPAQPSVRVSPVERRREQLVALVHAYADTPLANHVKKEYSRITEAGASLEGVPSESSLFAIEQMLGPDPSTETANELLRAFEESLIREAYQGAVVNLRRAEAGRDEAEIQKAQAECTKLSQRLAGLGR